MSDHAMTIGLDLGDRHSHVFLLMETGEEERARITTTPTGISRFFGRVSPARIVLEVGTHSRWVSKYRAGINRNRDFLCNCAALHARTTKAVNSPITHRFLLPARPHYRRH